MAHALLDYGIEHELLWVCFSDSTGECWTFSNTEIRAQKNLTQGREHISPFYNPDDVAFKEKEDPLQEIVEKIRNHHRSIIDDWCKAYMAQIYQEEGSIKPGDFILNEQVPTLKDGLMVRKYWFEKKPKEFVFKKNCVMCGGPTEFCQMCGNRNRERNEND